MPHQDAGKLSILGGAELYLGLAIKFNIRVMNPSRLSVSIKDDLDRQSTNRGFRNFENHACLDFGFRCARFS